MTNYRIYIRSNEHPRTINTPMLGRTYYSVIPVNGRDALIAKVAELRDNGKIILEIRAGCGGTAVYL